MSGDKEIQGQGAPQQEMQAGFCSATCVDRTSLQNEIKKPELKTSDIFTTCNLPKRFEHPHWFNGYGCQVSKQHPFYRTSASEYGWFPPDWHSVPTVYFPKNQRFSSSFALSGIHSVPSVFFPAGQTFTNRLSAAGMYRNYSLNTGMDPVGYS